MLPTGDGRIAWIDPRDIAAVAAAVLADPDSAARARSGSPARRRSTAAELATPDRARSTGVEIALVQPDLDDVARRAASPAAWIRGSPTRPCTSTKRSRAARWPTSRPTSSACSAGRRARSTTGSRDELVPLLRDASDASANARSGSSTTRGSRSKRIVAGAAGQPGSPSRANAAHASRIDAPERARGVVGADELGPPVDEVAERERDVDAVARAEPRVAAGQPKRYEYVGPCARCASRIAAAGTCIWMSVKSAAQISFVSVVPSAAS